MKKIIIGICVTLISLISIGGFYLFKVYDGGTDYYIKVTDSPIKQEEVKDDSGKTMGTQYTYQLLGSDEEGHTKEIEYYVYKEQPLRKNAYLKMVINEKRGPLRWEEVVESKIPERAKEKIE